MGIDVALAAIPFEERAIERSSSFEFLPDKRLRTCSAEDLIQIPNFEHRPRPRGRARPRFSDLPHLEKSPIFPQLSCSAGLMARYREISRTRTTTSTRTSFQLRSLDLIVYKAFADWPRDWVDIEGIVIRITGPELRLSPRVQRDPIGAGRW